MCVRKSQSAAVAVAPAAARPAPAEYSHDPSHQTPAAPSRAMRSIGRRAEASLAPKTFCEAAAAQYQRGGFST